MALRVNTQSSATQHSSSITTTESRWLKTALSSPATQTVKWRNVTPALATKMIQVTPELSVAETQALTAARQTADTSEEIKATDHVYIEKNGRYVLHRDVELMNGNHVLLDCQSNAVIA